MAYFEGFIVAVPGANKEAYRKQAAEAVPMFKELGATRLVEAWGDEVPDGETTDFKRAVKAEAEEVTVFAWLEYPSREVRDAANAKMMSDPRMKEMGENLPFDGKRMVFGGFAGLIDEGTREGTGYIDGTVVPVPAGRKEAFREMSAGQVALFKEYGALRVVDAWGDDLPDGKVTDFRRAVKAEGDEAVAFSWIEWPSKDVRDRAWQKLCTDPRMQAGAQDAPCDNQRRIYGGFAPIVDA